MKLLRLGIVLVVVLLAVSVTPGIAGGHGAAEPEPFGAFECPCISNTSHPALKEPRDALVKMGYPPTYGLLGCIAHDQNLSNDGCNVANPPLFCAAPWCSRVVCAAFPVCIR